MLAEIENLKFLSESIGVELELIKTEAAVGRYNVDILAKELNTGRKVIIENQIEPTIHDHLGKVITYAAGHDVVLAIWIVKNAKEEHARAVEWFNEHTDESIGGFLLEIEVLQIDESLPAPQFKIVVKPNEWAKAVKSDGDSRELTDTKQFQLQFWSDFKQYLEKKNPPFSLQTPKGQHWYNFTFGTSEAHLQVGLNTMKNLISCWLYINGRNGLFDFIYERKDYVESKLGKGEWFNKKDSGFIIRKEVDDTLTESKELREQYFKWFYEELIAFKKVFSELVENFNKQKQ